MTKLFQSAMAEYIPLIFHSLMRAAVLFVVALGIVYAIGRMLMLINAPRSKNLVAILIIPPLAYWSIHIYDLPILISTQEIWWRTMVYSSLAYTMYVLIGFDLYDRWNRWTDKKLGSSPQKNKEK